MGGGIIQLYAIGKQDKPLIGNPQITFFKQMYKRYTNFGIEQIKQYFTGNINLGQRIRCKIQRKGDLLSNMYVVFDICKSDCLQQIPIRKLGLKLIEYIDIEIGGQLIDRHYGEWLDVWSQLSHTYEEYQMTKILMGDSERINIFNTSNNKIYVPLYFWFNRDPGLALPLLSLQFHEVNIYLKLRPASQIFYFPNTKYGLPRKDPRGNKETLSCENNESANCGHDCSSFFDTFYDKYKPPVPSACMCTSQVKSTSGSGSGYNTWVKKSIAKDDIIFNGIYLVCDYIFLSSEERKLFVNKPLEYLITQVQCTGKVTIASPLCSNGDSQKSTNTEMILNFNYPVKEIYWCIYPTFFDNSYIYKNMDLSNTMIKGELFVNNTRYHNITDYNYFSIVQPYQHHKCGGLIGPGTGINTNGGFYTYSFSLDPETKQPNGTLNFSKINDCVLNFTYQKTNNRYSIIDVPYVFMGFGLSYNVLRIYEGMGKLEYI